MSDPTSTPILRSFPHATPTTDSTTNSSTTSSHASLPPPSSSSQPTQPPPMASPTIIPSLAPAMTRTGLLPSPSMSQPASSPTSLSPNPPPGSSSDFSSFMTGPLDSTLIGYYPGLLESMRLDTRGQRLRGKILASQSWKKILTFVIENAKAATAGGGSGGSNNLAAGGPNGGGLSSKKGLPKDLIPPSSRGDVLRGFGSGEEVYGLGGGYNPLTKDHRSRSSAAKAGRFREPDTETWHEWHAEEWKAWKEWRVREKERLAKLANGGIFIPGRENLQTQTAPTTGPLANIGFAALAAAGIKPTPRTGGTVDPELLLATASAKLKRDDLKSSMDLNLDLNPLDHIHTVRYTHAPIGAAGGAGGKKGRAIMAAHAKLRANDNKYQHEQKQRASELYRNIWIQQMKVMRSNKALSHYSEMWDRKLNNYKMTLERDGQGNKIKALHLMDEKEKRKVLLAQNGQDDPTMYAYDDTTQSGSDSDGSVSDAEQDEAQTTEGGDGQPMSNLSHPAMIRKLQANNPHKHIYHGAMSARNFKSQLNANMVAELMANGASTGSLSARARDSSNQPSATASSFETMLANGLAQAQQQQQQQLAANATTSSKVRAPNLFARAILQLKNRKLIVSFDEKEMNELKDIFDTLARDGYSKLTKGGFKSVILNHFSQIGVGPVMNVPLQNNNANNNSALTSPASVNGLPSQPIYIDRTRLDPLLDRLWLAVNSNGRNSNFLDFADFSQMIGIALNGTAEDRAAFCFEIYDMDDDGYLDIHDLFVCLNLSLDEYFPRDFHLIASNLYEKMDLYESIWKNRQEKIMDLAAKEREIGLAKQQQLQQQLSARSSRAVSTEPTPVHSSQPSTRDLHNVAPPPLQHDFSNSSFQSNLSAREPYVHQELPVLHITKQEFIRLHLQAYANGSNNNSGAHDYSNMSSPPFSPHPPNSSSNVPPFSGHEKGAAAFRAATYALSGFNPPAPQQPQYPTHWMDLIELIPKCFFFPYIRRPIGVGSHGKPSAFNLPRESSMPGSGSLRERELMKERQLTTTKTSLTEEKTQNATAKALGPNMTSQISRLASLNRKGVHNLEEMKANALAASQKPPLLPAHTLVPLHPAAGDSSTLNEIDQLLNRLRTTSQARLSKSVFRKIFLSYLALGPNHQFHALNPAQAALDIAEEEKIIDFLFYALDVHKTGSLDGNYVAAMLGFVLKGESESQLKFYHRLLDLDRDGFVTAKDLCLAHDLTTSYTLRSDLKVLLEVFSNKIEQVIVNTRRTVHEIEERNRPHVNLRDIIPDTLKTESNEGKEKDESNMNGDPAQAVSSTHILMDQHQQLAQLRLHAHVGISLEEFHDALLKFNPSLFLKILKRAPYQRFSRFQAATATPRAVLGLSKGALNPIGGTGHKGEEALAAEAAGFEELHHLHRSLLRELKVCTQIDFGNKFPDAHNSNIGDQITTLRRSLDFQNDTQFETRIFYLSNQFGKVTSANGQIQPTTQMSMDQAYNSIQRLLTRVPQVYVQWTLLQDGSKHTSIETAKFRKATTKYGLVTKNERRKARFKMIATPGSIYAYGGFPRPKTGDLDRADLQHYGTPLRCILLSVSGAQLNEQGLDDLDFIKVNPETGEKFLDQPQFFYELCAQVHLWLIGFVEMVELENIRAIGSHLSQSGSTSISGSAIDITKTGLMRVVRIGAGNFAAVPGMKEHQGNLIAYLLMHAFLYNLKKNSQTIMPKPPTPLPPPPPTGHGRYGHAKTGSTASSIHAGRVGAQTPSTPAVAPTPAPPEKPTIVSQYKNLSVIEFIFFDEDACPIPPDPENGDKRMCGGVELRFSKRDVLELTTHHTSHHHIGILNPMDSFALPGNEEGYTSLASMMGNNTSLRLMQSYHFNMHLLHAANYIPIEPTPELSQPTYDQEMWHEMKAILGSDKSPKKWYIEPEIEEVKEPTPEPEEEEESEYDPEDLANLTTDM